jgi:2-dehydro-3-deoxy-D-arabinonate dehydratase
VSFHYRPSTNERLACVTNQPPRNAEACLDGSNAGIGLRTDSKFTAPEPELSVVLGSDGRIVGYTIANDVSAWDIEKKNPLYLPQSKQYAVCCSLGPVMVTADELTDPYKIDMTCTIKRGETQTFY